MKTPLTVSKVEEGTRLRRFLLRYFPDVPMMAVRKLCRTGEIRINSKRCKESDVLMTGDIVRIPPLLKQKVAGDLRAPDGTQSAVRKYSLAELEKLRQTIIHDDDDIVVFNKPAGLAVQGGGGIKKSLDKMVKELFPNDNMLLVHRLDMETSGAIVVAKNTIAAQKLTAAFQSHEVQKVYLAILKGSVRPTKGMIDLPINDKTAITGYRVLEEAKGYLTLIRYFPETGRKHQLRIHSAFGLNAPIVGDRDYGSRAKDKELKELLDVNNMYLFAEKITFRHPKSGKILTIAAEMPKWFKQAVRFIEGDK